jgi:hypothetical protein
MVLPSILDTPANLASMPDADYSRWVSLDEIAAAILFLASDTASAVSGASLPVKGRAWIAAAFRADGSIPSFSIDPESSRRTRRTSEPGTGSTRPWDGERPGDGWASEDVGAGKAVK